MKKSYNLLTPGPVPLTSSIKNILSKQPEYHRGLKFQHLFKEVKKNLKTFFQTKESVIILTSTGTGAMESALTNTLSPQDRVLCVCGGKFGERWKEISESYGLEVTSIDVVWGEAVDPKKIKEHLQKDSNIKAVLISACETSTATSHPIKEISDLLKNYPQTLFIVDAITALGAMPLPMDLWNLDVLIGGSQKSFLLPTGLSFIALSQKAWNFQKQSRFPKYYFDLKREKEDQDKGHSSFSINVSFIQALEESLNFLLNQRGGLEKNIKRCEQLTKATHLFCKELGLELFSKNPSTSVTALTIPAPISAEAIKKSLEEKANIIVAGGQGPLKNKIIRIGHLGFIENKNLLNGLKSLAQNLHQADSKQFPKNKIKTSLKLAKKELSKKI
ncbi:MAG: pyridoxal-phosphate-dependent aminotransferase family protein [Bdellovibrionales bacterium]